MSLKFEIQGTIQGEGGRFKGRLDGFEVRSSRRELHRKGLHDPSDPTGAQALDDPSDPTGAQALDDPSDPTGAQALDDPRDPHGAYALDNPQGKGYSTYSHFGDCSPTCHPEGGSSQPTSHGPYPREQLASSRLYSGFIIVRLSPLISPDAASDSLEDLAELRELSALTSVLQRFGSPPSRPAVNTRGAAAIDEFSKKAPRSPRDPVPFEDLERRAAASSIRPRHSLRAYWRLDGRAMEGPTPGPGDEASGKEFGLSLDEVSARLVDHLNALGEVDLAYRELAASDPGLQAAVQDSLREPSSDELSDFQLSLGPGPLGINAFWARERLQDGSEVLTVNPPIDLADLEQGWNLDHRDLGPMRKSLPLHGENRRGKGEFSGDHGTAVLGQLIGKGDNGLGVVGIAEGVARISLASHFRSEKGGRPCNGCVADAINALMTQGELGPGAVLLLEVQRAGQPVEVDELDFDAIRLAVANGIIVVEAAGNGGLDLDRVVSEGGRSLDRRSPRFQDSGALVVGAAKPALSHDRASFSNYGSRVDCFAWGGGVTTAGYGDLLGGAGDEHFTDRFSGTSSAAAMIAGAATLVQALYQQHAGPRDVEGLATEKASWRRLAPGRMRSVLSNPRGGTAQGSGVAGAIGTMPDLRKVVEDLLGLVPRVYLRDHQGDDGEIASLPRRSVSPDIVVSGGLGRKVAVTVRNGGLRDAMKARVLLYCAPVLTLPTPDRWGQPLGGSEGEVATVPQGDLPKNLECPAWRLESGNHCLIATVEVDGGDMAPGPCRPAAFDGDSYFRVLRRQRNLAVRNVHTISPKEQAKFLLNGTPDLPRPFTFEVIQRLPQGVHLKLTALLAIAAKFSRGQLWSVARGPGDSKTAALQLPMQPRLPLGKLALPPGKEFECSFVLGGKRAEIRDGHSFALRQLFQGEEVGRITWQFRC